MKEANGSEQFTSGLINHISTYIGEMTQEEQLAIAKQIRFSSFNKNELIFRQGEIPKKVCFLIEGAVRFYYTTEDGKEHTTNFSFRMEPVVPYGSFVEQSPSGVSIAAINAVQVAWTSYDGFNEFLKEHPRFQAGIAKLLGEYLIKGSQQLSLLRIGSARERYEKLQKTQPMVIEQIPLTYIASYLDMALETLSRVRAGKL